MLLVDLVCVPAVAEPTSATGLTLEQISYRGHQEPALLGGDTGTALHLEWQKRVGDGSRA